MRRPALLIMLLLSLTCAAGTLDPWTDMQAAHDWCDSSPLDRIEGVWEFPDDGVRVLIIGINGESSYELRVIEGADGKFDPGDVIGIAVPTTDPVRFAIKMRTKLGGPLKALKGWKKCTAKLTTSDMALDVATESHSINWNFLGFLPHFWRVARLRHSDPQATLPHGMIKIYPSYDGNGSSRFNPRYL